MESLRISRVGPSKALKNVFSSDMDISFELYHHIMHSPFEFLLEHVKAHQDDDTEYDHLSVEAKINVQCDKYVSLYFVNPDKACIPHCESRTFRVHVGTDCML